MPFTNWNPRKSSYIQVNDAEEDYQEYEQSSSEETEEEKMEYKLELNYLKTEVTDIRSKEKPEMRRKPWSYRSETLQTGYTYISLCMLFCAPQGSYGIYPLFHSRIYVVPYPHSGRK